MSHYSEFYEREFSKRPRKRTVRTEQRRAKRQLEDEHQKSLMQWSQLARIDHTAPIADYLIHIPNGGSRHKAEAAKLKAMGVKAGVSDLLLAYPRHGKAGLWIELKAPKPKSGPKPRIQNSQIEWIQKMNDVGYQAVVCFGWQQARIAITNYLRGEQS